MTDLCRWPKNWYKAQKNDFPKEKQNTSCSSKESPGT